MKLKRFYSGISKKLTHLVVVLLSCALICPMLAVAGKGKKSVLILHSYHKGLSWTDSITKGIEKRFAEEGKDIELSYEYMDTKRFFSKEHYQNIERVYKLKYLTRKADLVISSDDNAFQFLLEKSEDLFAGMPIVFCGVNNFQRDLLKGRTLITGVREAFDFGATIEVGVSLKDGINKVLVIGDQTTSGRANRDNLQALIPKFNKDISFEFMDNHSMAEVLARVRSLEDDTIVFWLHFTADKAGDFYSFEDSSEMISQASSAPLFSSWDFHMDHGIVGGMITSGVQQGYTAAGLAVRILQGESTSSIAVVETSPNRYMFDYNELKRFNIDVSRLPADSEIINLPHSFFSDNKGLVLSTVGGFVFLVVIIVLLIVNIYRRKQVGKLLTETKDRYLGIFNDTSVALLVEDFSPLVADFRRIEREAGGKYREYFFKNQTLLGELGKKIEIRDVNPAAIKLYGAKSKLQLAGNLNRIQSLAKRSELTDFLIAILEKRREFTAETVNRTLSGKDINVILKVNIPKDFQGYDNILVCIVDISERKRAEQALIDSENRFRTAFNNAATGMALLSVEGQYIKVNRALCTILGYGEEELLGKCWMDVTHPDDVEVSQTIVDKLIDRKECEPFEKRYLSKTGDVIWTLFSGSLIFDSKGMPAYFISQFQNITQRKMAEAKLIEQKERYRKYFEDDLSGVFVISYTGNFITCNQVFREIFGLDRSVDLQGMNYFDFFQKNEDGKKFFNSLVLHKKLEYFELRLKKQDGTALDVVINAIGRFSESGKLREIQGYIMDVTHQKNLETQLFQVQKLESIGTMAGGVAHDFNNLLMGVLGNTSLLLFDKDDRHPDFKRLKNIEEYVKSGSSLTKQLLGFAKGGKYEVKTCDINDIISSNSDMFCRTRKEIQINLELEAKEKAVDVDRSQIDQVMYNLYVNAWQAMVDGGEILIRTKNIELDEAFVAPYNVKKGEYIKIEVRDNGAGMDQQTLKRIFDPFFTTKEISRGIGLGLASSYGIIQNHSGIIKADSNVGEGTVFSIYLPVSSNTLTENGTLPLQEKLIKGKERVLIVDDEEMITEVGSQMLTALGYEVETAGSGKEAIDTFEKMGGKIDLVILDMIMPGMGGGETFDVLKKIDTEVKTILSSGYSLDQKANAILQRGCLGFLQKPFDLQSLSDKMRQVLDNPLN